MVCHIGPKGDQRGWFYTEAGDRDMEKFPKLSKFSLVENHTKY